MGIVSNIQRFTIHDGPGIRTEVFLKGCPLSCKWCGNPESLQLKPQIGFFSAKCIGDDRCGLCNKNRDSFESVDRCPADALKIWGSDMSSDEVMEVILRDRGYYDESNGGVTISGGEPLMQHQFVVDIFKKCKQENINTCMESSLFGKWEHIKEVLDYTDILITDIKVMDTKIHEAYTGVGNELILENISKACKMDIPVIIRIPVIPEVNDSMDNMVKTADFIIGTLENRIKKLQLLQYMRLGVEKYASLGIEYPMGEVDIDREKFNNRIKGFAGYFNSREIDCSVGTKEKLR